MSKRPVFFGIGFAGATEASFRMASQNSSLFEEGFSLWTDAARLIERTYSRSVSRLIDLPSRSIMKPRLSRCLVKKNISFASYRVGYSGNPATRRPLMVVAFAFGSHRIRLSYSLLFMRMDCFAVEIA
jgi:hypothetical protein